MKKLICILLTAAVFLGLCACGRNNDSDYERYMRELEKIESLYESNSTPTPKPSEEPTKAPTPTPEPTEEPTSEPSEEPTSGIRPEVKEAIDAYEVFIDEYIEFMNKYAESDNPLLLLTDYLDMLQRYTEELEKFSNLDADLTTEESTYYLNVSMRCLEKIASVLTSDSGND